MEKNDAEIVPQETKELLDELKQQSVAAEASKVGQRNNHDHEGGNAKQVHKDPNDGTEYEWDEEKRAWFPKIDEDFIAMYQMNYGFREQESTNNKETESTDDKQVAPEPIQPPETSAVGEKRKAKEPPAWFEMDEDKNTNIYISGLPTNTTDEEFLELLSKCGIIMEDQDTRKPKVKLYRDKDGNLKGDGRCCYLKIESVHLAIQLLDDSDFKGSRIKVEKAHFEMKGKFNAALKPKKKKKKKKKAKGQEKLLDWVEREEKVSKLDRIVIIKNMFNPEDFEKNPAVLLDFKDDIRKECEKYGQVKKVIVFDRHEDGVVSVGFSEVEPSEACLKAMHGRWFAGRKLVAERWDGVTKYDIEETEEQKEARLKKWDEYLENAENEEDEAQEK